MAEYPETPERAATSTSSREVTESMLDKDHPDLQSAESGNPPILPRQAWHSQLAWLRATIKAKQALDRQEKAFFS